MSSKDDENKIHTRDEAPVRQSKGVKYMSGLERPEPPQLPGGKDGDPQKVALCQALADRGHLGLNNVIVDIGSGAGVLPEVMLGVWSGSNIPMYVAVDLPEQLEKLALPTLIHNNSKKIEFKDFFEQKNDGVQYKPDLVVIRNVLHELDIETTSYVLFGLQNQFPEGTEIYIQDMRELSRAERGNAGWYPDCLKILLQAAGIEIVQQFELKSHSGIPWFTMTGIVRRSSKSINEIMAVCAEQRRKQKIILSNKIRSIMSDYSPESTGQYQILYTELAHIELQLGVYDSKSLGLTQTLELDLGSVQLPLRSTSDKQAFALDPIDQEFASETGIVAALRTKDAVNIPELINRSQKLICFVGYSNRPTFEISHNRDSIKSAVLRGVNFKALICRSDSEATLARAKAPVYENRNSLLDDIQNSESGAVSLFKEILGAVKKQKYLNFDVRVTENTPPCSYFIIDNLCFASIYTTRLGGAVTPSLVFKAINAGHGGFYELLWDEFSHEWESSVSIFPG